MCSYIKYANKIPKKINLSKSQKNDTKYLNNKCFMIQFKFEKRLFVPLSNKYQD